MARSTSYRTIPSFHHFLEPEVSFNVDSYGSAPVTSGPPEAFDAGDPPEISINGIWLGEVFILAADLTQPEYEYIERVILEDMPEPEDDYDF